MAAGGTAPTGLAEPPTQSAPHSSLQKYDYDSSSVRKRFFREALLQVTIPFLLKKLAPTCKSVSPRPASPAPRPLAVLTRRLCPPACRSCHASRS